LGYHSKDNGFASFDHVRIPREDMMMGITNVDRDGSFSISGDPRMLYIIMMSIRNQIVGKGTAFMG
jgi:acyl-CoA oxidase